MRKEELLTQLGDPFTNRVVDRLHNFAYIPQSVLGALSQSALAEQWGDGGFVLKKYLAVHIPWSVEQGRFSSNEDQLYFTAGHLQTRYGTPIYLIFERNRGSGDSPWAMIFAGSDISAPELPTPPDIPEAPQIPVGAEVVMMHDHMLGDNSERVPLLSQTPSVAQMCAVSGAIQWSINRKLQFPYWYFGRMNHLVPLYLQSREDITRTPDLIAPVQVNPDSLLVRTLLEPHMPYANARVAVRRHDQLPAWLLDGWSTYAATAEDNALEDLELSVSSRDLHIG